MVEFVDVLQEEKNKNHNILQVLALAALFVFDADIDTHIFFF